MDYPKMIYAGGELSGEYRIVLQGTLDREYTRFDESWW